MSFCEEAKNAKKRNRMVAANGFMLVDRRFILFGDELPGWMMNKPALLHSIRRQQVYQQFIPLYGDRKVNGIVKVNGEGCAVCLKGQVPRGCRFSIERFLGRLRTKSV